MEFVLAFTIGRDLMQGVRFFQVQPFSQSSCRAQVQQCFRVGVLELLNMWFCGLLHFIQGLRRFSHFGSTVFVCGCFERDW